MPRVADHAERRALIARTFQRHVGEHGLAATTFAKVAAAAGISVGLIQHYFSSKDALLRYVFADVLRRRDERIARHIADGESSQRPIRDIIAAALYELLPLDARRTQEHHVTQALRTEALHDVGLAEVAAQADRELHQRAATAVANGKLCGEVAEQVDAGVAATRILATVHGLSSDLALRRAGTDEVDEVLAPVLGTVFTGVCRRHDNSPATSGVSAP